MRKLAIALTACSILCTGFTAPQEENPLYGHPLRYGYHSPINMQSAFMALMKIQRYNERMDRVRQGESLQVESPNPKAILMAIEMIGYCVDILGVMEVNLLESHNPEFLDQVQCKE